MKEGHRTKDEGQERIFLIWAILGRCQPLPVSALPTSLAPHSGQGTGHIGATRLPEDHTRLTCQQEHSSGGLGTLSVVTVNNESLSLDGRYKFTTSCAPTSYTGQNASYITVIFQESRLF